MCVITTAAITLLFLSGALAQVNELGAEKEQLAADKNRMAAEKQASLDTMTRTLALATEKASAGCCSDASAGWHVLGSGRAGQSSRSTALLIKLHARVLAFAWCCRRPL